jgi:hypothetical protein
MTASHYGHTVISVVVAAVLTGAIYGVGMIVLRRDLVFDVVGLMRRSTASLTG